MPLVLEHCGLLGVYLDSPDVVMEFHHELRGSLGSFGCYACSELELFDFVLFRAARLCGCGQFDSELEYVLVIVKSAGHCWTLVYDIGECKFNYVESMHETVE